jgi:hypothetical protein
MTPKTPMICFKVLTLANRQAIGQAPKSAAVTRRAGAVLQSPP